MWRFIIFLIFLIVSVWFGVEVIRHPGYLLLVYQPWMVQMPIWFALLAALIFLVLFYWVIDSIDKTQFLWFRLKNWLTIRREHKSYSKTQQGLEGLIEGNWKKAERLLLAGVNQSVEPLINYLAAAKAAHEQGVFERRDNYIRKAYKVAPHAEIAIGITQAELEIEQHQMEQALATLNNLRPAATRHPRVLKLLEKAYVHLGDWKNVQALLPSMKKAKLLTPNEYELFEKNITCERLRSSTTKTYAELQGIWQEMPRYLRKNPQVVCEYAKQLISHQSQYPEIKPSEIEELLRKTLKSHWQPELVNLYATLPIVNLNRQLVIVGAWLKMYGDQPELLLLLGKLCTQGRLWGKAKDYYERSLALRPSAEVTLEYGKLLEQLGEESAALRMYKEGLGRLVN